MRQNPKLSRHNHITVMSTMDDENDLNFEHDDTLECTTLAYQSSQSSSTCSILSRAHRTKRMRLNNKNTHDEVNDSKTVRFSMSPPRESMDSSNRQRRRKTVRSSYSTADDDAGSVDSSIESSLNSAKSSQRHSSSQSSSQLSSQSSSKLSSPSKRSSRSSQRSLQSPSKMSSRSSQYSSLSPSQQVSSQEVSLNVPVRGAGTDVVAVQDAGSFRMLYDDCFYLCAENSVEACCDLAVLLSSRKTRSVLFSDQQGAALAAILQAISSFASKNEQDKPMDKQLHEALAAVVHFVSWDCTTHTGGSAAAARKVRNAVLEHPRALQGICNLVLVDPIVQSLLTNKTTSTVKDDNSVLSQNDDNASRASSIDTRESTASSQGDPTSMGRRKRRKKRRMQFGRPMLSAIDEDAITEDATTENGEVDGLFAAQGGMSFTSDEASVGYNRKPSRDDASLSTVESVSERNEEKLVKVREALEYPAKDEDGKARPVEHTCKILSGKKAATDSEEGDGRMDLFLHGELALQALNRIVEGKEGDEESCIEIEMDASDRNSKDASTNQEEDDEEEQLKRNPLLITNTLLRKNGALPLLARAMAEALSAAIVCVTPKAPGESPCCECLSHLKERVSILASLIDGACCLTSENRRELCAGNSQLMSSILLFLKTFSDQTKCSSSESVSVLLDEIALSTLRTLTSLTHDNALAGSLLMASYKPHISLDESLPGVLILANLLWRTISYSKCSSSNEQPSDRQLHNAYDMTIFCLNTLSNAIEAKDLRKVLAEHKVPVSHDTNDNDSREELFLTWLSRTIFCETASFRDAVMRGTFGEKAHQDTTRDLEKHEEEHLITAGNGFILMVCLMKSRDHELSTFIRKVILQELQVDGSSSRLVLIKNTLKAFCNFYHFSLGDLSVAIVGPVGRLIAEVENMQNAI